MKPRAKKLCEVCAKSFSSANIARHKLCLHSYCVECKLLVSRKRHRCFKGVGLKQNFAPTIPPNQDDQFLLVHIPVLIGLKLYKQLDAYGSVWPVYDIQGDKRLVDQTKKVLAQNCITCSVSEFIDVPNDRHSCINPNYEEFVSALRQCTDNVSEQVVNDVYKKAFGRDGRPPDGFVL